MKTGTIIAIGAAVVGVGGLGYYLLSRPAASQSNSLLPQSTDPAASGSNVNLLDIFNQLKPYLPSQNTTNTGTTSYEGKLVRINKDKVYLVKDGLLRYVSVLPLSDGRGWESVTELKSLALPEGPALNGIGQVSSRLLQ